MCLSKKGFGGVKESPKRMNSGHQAGPSSASGSASFPFANLLRTEMARGRDTKWVLESDVMLFPDTRSLCKNCLTAVLGVMLERIVTFDNGHLILHRCVLYRICQQDYRGITV